MIIVIVYILESYYTIRVMNSMFTQRYGCSISLNIDPPSSLHFPLRPDLLARHDIPHLDPPRSRALAPTEVVQAGSRSFVQLYREKRSRGGGWE